MTFNPHESRDAGGVGLRARADQERATQRDTERMMERDAAHDVSNGAPRDMARVLCAFAGQDASAFQLIETPDGRVRMFPRDEIEACGLPGEDFSPLAAGAPLLTTYEEALKTALLLVREMNSAWSQPGRVRRSREILARVIEDALASVQTRDDSPATEPCDSM
jgi:hypothetical protein